MNLSIAIPTHGDRWKWTGQTFHALRDDKRIKEIVIYDDASGDDIWPHKIGKEVDQFRTLERFREGYPKVHLWHSCEKQGVFRNKYLSVAACQSEYVALLDSDNIFGPEYINAFFAALPGIVDINCPEQARPRFNFSKWQKHIIMRRTVSLYMDDPLFCVLMNTGNYIVKRQVYLNALKVFFDNKENPPSCCDVIWQNYHMLRAGAFMKVVPGMGYEHTDHPDSTYRQNVGKEQGQTEVWQNMVRGLK